MANTLYDAARKRFLEAQINWMTDTIKVYLVDTGAYTPVVGTHEYLSDIPTSARIAGPVTLTSKTTTGGAADAADITFTSVLCWYISHVHSTSRCWSKRPVEWVNQNWVVMAGSTKASNTSATGRRINISAKA